MCTRCDEVDVRIVQFERARSQADDRLAIALLDLAIEDFIEEKRALHPELPSEG